MLKLVAFLALSVIATTAHAKDPIVTDGDKTPDIQTLLHEEIPEGFHLAVTPSRPRSC
jgi:hypothetical protein